MKLSKYNLIIKESEGKESSYIAYNLLKQTAFKINTQLKKTLEEEKFDRIADAKLRQLENKGIVVCNEINELQEFKAQYKTTKYDYKGPLIFTFTPTYKCNLFCEYCYLGRGEKLTKTIDRSTFLSAIKFIQSRLEKSISRQCIINFYGGEPMLELEKIVKILKIFNRNVIKILISTNGTLLTRNIVKELKNYPIVFQITLAGSEEIHNKKRRYKKGGGTFKDILNGVHILNNEKIIPNVRVDIDKENYNSIEALLDRLTDEGIREKIFLSFELIFGSYYARNYPHCLEDRSSLIRLWKMASVKGFKLLTGKSTWPFTFCLQQTNRSYIIDPYGELYFCTGYMGDQRYKIGHVHEDLDKINYKYYDWLSRNPTEIKKCKNCLALPLCCGGCAMKAHRKYGTFHNGFCDGFDNNSFLQEYMKFLQNWPERPETAKKLIRNSKILY